MCKRRNAPQQSVAYCARAKPKARSPPAKPKARPPPMSILFKDDDKSKDMPLGI
jgi:hypothetical protein